MQRLSDLVRSKSKDNNNSNGNSNSNLSNSHSPITESNNSLSPSSKNMNAQLQSEQTRTRSFLWSWGNLSSKIPAKHKQRTPLLTESLETQRIASITCDSRHIIVVTRDGVVFLWELGKSLSKISKKQRYSNYKTRPESLHKLVSLMRNQLPIVSNFELSHSQSQSLSHSLNKRIFLWLRCGAMAIITRDLRGRD